MYMQSADPGMNQGGTVTGHETAPSIEAYENIFGPVARDIKQDSQRHKRHQRWHLPDVLKGPNAFLTDRVDGLITDATNSPFTRNILPYVYLANPDQKLKWNVYSFDEGMASRVPYEAAARVLPQSKRSFAGYAVRQGLAIAMEHNFMMSQKGQENFRNQLMQLVGSIQLTNDLDVHIALLTAPSFQKQQNEKYMDVSKTLVQLSRKFIDCFGIMQKIPNALDMLIEDAKTHMKTWGSQPPTFCLCNPALQTQLTMLPEKTNYVTNGPDGLKRLAQGPDLPSYRGLSFINTRKFSMESGAAPRDLLRRRVRVGEYYWCRDLKLTNQVGRRTPDAPHLRHEAQAQEDDSYFLYDQSRDDMVELCVHDLLHASDFPFYTNADAESMSRFKARLVTRYVKLKYDTDLSNVDGLNDINNWDHSLNAALQTRHYANPYDTQTFNDILKAIFNNVDLDIIFEGVNNAPFWNTWFDHAFGDNFFGFNGQNHAADSNHDFLILRPNIEHEMLGVIFGRGGTQELGSTFWGQTELSCYDDAQHGIWGMSYKYHERALVTNEKNLIRVYDVAFDGYNGGMDTTALDWMSEDSVEQFREATLDKSVPYNGASMLVMRLPSNAQKNCFSNPLIFGDDVGANEETGERAKDYKDHMWDGAKQNLNAAQKVVLELYWERLNIQCWNPLSMRGKLPGEQCVAGECGQLCMAFQGTLQKKVGKSILTTITGAGHLGQSFPGVASIREGRGMLFTLKQQPQIMHMM